MESSDVDERVGGSESFPCHVPVVVVIHVFIVVHLRVGLIRKSETLPRPCVPFSAYVGGGGDGDDGVWLTFLWHGYVKDEYVFWDAIMCWVGDELAEAGAAKPVVVLCPALLGDVPFR